MLNDRDRNLLNDLERQLQQEDAAWMRQFKDLKAPRQARHVLQLATAIGLLVLLAALCLLLGTALGDINWALQRLDRGTYGTCERCTAPVPIERLNILPMARLCMPCQRRSEASKPGGPAGGNIG